MPRLALTFAFGATLCAGLPFPGLYLAIGLGIAAIGAGWAGFARTAAPGWARLGSAAAVTMGTIGLVLGAVRVVIALAAIDRIDHLLG